MHYSTKFIDETAGQIDLVKLISDNEIVNNSDKILSLKIWEEMRHFISLAITKDCSLLDLGCANGFLLKSLQEWSDYKITPYGIDLKPELINDAKKIFPNQKNNFECMTLTNKSRLPTDFPDKFDIIYWSAWMVVKPENYRFFVDSLMSRVNTGGKIIIGFYDWSDKKTIARVQKLNNMKLEFDGMIENPLNEEFLIWIDKK